VQTVDAQGTQYETDVRLTTWHAIGSYRNVVIVLWRGETTLSAVAQLREVLRELIAEYPEGIGLIQVVETSAPPPDAVARKAIARLLAQERGYLKGSALVFEEGGFRMAAVRAIVSGIATLARPGYPHVVFATVLEAADWLVELLPAASGGWAYAGGVVQAVERLRHTLDAA
jgi:hypothetical protein